MCARTCILAAGKYCSFYQGYKCDLHTVIAGHAANPNLPDAAETEIVITLLLPLEGL